MKFLQIASLVAFASAQGDVVISGNGGMGVMGCASSGPGLNFQQSCKPSPEQEAADEKKRKMCENKDFLLKNRRICYRLGMVWSKEQIHDIEGIKKCDAAFTADNNTDDLSSCLWDVISRRDHIHARQLKRGLRAYCSVEGKGDVHMCQKIGKNLRHFDAHVYGDCKTGGVYDWKTRTYSRTPQVQKPDGHWHRGRCHFEEGTSWETFIEHMVAEGDQLIPVMSVANGNGCVQVESYRLGRNGMRWALHQWAEKVEKNGGHASTDTCESQGFKNCQDFDGAYDIDITTCWK